MPGDSSGWTPGSSGAGRFRVVIVGGGLAGLESALALAELAGELIDVTVIAPNSHFVYRPMTIREPFSDGAARRYAIGPILSHAGAALVEGELGWIDRGSRTVHTTDGEAIVYDALVLALGARVTKRYEHALTIDDRDLDETMHGVIQDVEGGYIQKLAFVSPGRMAWPLPLYEFALMTAGRAFDAGVDLQATLVTPEDAPLGIFGPAASSSVAALLRQANVETINSAYAEVPSANKVVIKPGDRHLAVDRVIALPELFGPELRGVPLGDHGFLRVDPYCRVRHVERIYAAGDATDFPVKHGGVGAHQADVAARSIAALAGAPILPEPFNPMIHGMLMTGGKPVYLTARLAGGHGFDSDLSDIPTWSPPSKIAAKYLAPYLAELDRDSATAQ